ncbi:UNKNOWN [Stylonychia lemnae]|uniref:Uncharacterized protein n=1 Tax=Stylonychia lemnae TaxID=5949 RepID=A0A078AZB6_STYLE|nr:UNKNOWN [Stylonychia lemnae]|eukprot:CDW87785.1 UNKNOWN [Stylonychia lemnae]
MSEKCRQIFQKQPIKFETKLRQRLDTIYTEDSNNLIIQSRMKSRSNITSQDYNISDDESLVFDIPSKKFISIDFNQRQILSSHHLKVRSQRKMKKMKMKAHSEKNLMKGNQMKIQPNNIKLILSTARVSFLDLNHTNHLYPASRTTIGSCRAELRETFTPSYLLSNEGASTATGRDVLRSGYETIDLRPGNNSIKTNQGSNQKVQLYRQLHEQSRPFNLQIPTVTNQAKILLKRKDPNFLRKTTTDVTDQLKNTINYAKLIKMNQHDIKDHKTESLIDQWMNNNYTASFKSNDLVSTHQSMTLQNYNSFVKPKIPIQEQNSESIQSINITSVSQSKDRIKLELNPLETEMEEIKLNLGQVVSDQDQDNHDHLTTETYNFEEDFKDSLITLAHGIPAEKFHYSKQHQDKCTLLLSPTLKYIKWIYHHKQVGVNHKDKIGRCDLDTIKGIIFGAQSSTFLRYRQKILKDINNHHIRAPFYAWQCVQGDEHDEEIEINTFVLQLLNEKYQKNPMILYKFLRIKMKISYEACRKAMSVQELFIGSIIKVYKKNLKEKNLDEEPLELEENLTFKSSIINSPSRRQKTTNPKSGFGQAIEDQQEDHSDSFIKKDVFLVPRQNAEIDLRIISEESSFDEEEFFQKNYKTHSNAKNSLHTLKTIMILKSLQVVKGLHKLRILQRKQKLSKFNFIKALQQKGFSKIPDDLKVSKLPSAFHFYDPIPKMIELHANPNKLHRLKPIESNSDITYNKYSIEDQQPEQQQGCGPQTSRTESKGFFGRLFCCFKTPTSAGSNYFNKGIKKSQNYLIKQPSIQRPKRTPQRKKSNDKSSTVSLKDSKLSLQQVVQLAQLKKSYNEDLEIHLKPGNQITKEELDNKQLFIRQLMNLKVKGRFIEETQQFISEIGQKPSIESQKKMIKGLSYQNEDQYDDFCKKVKQTKSFSKKQYILNETLNQEFFYYNPLYKDLLKKKNSLMVQTETARQNFRNKGKIINENVFIIKEFKPAVTYRKKRKKQKFRGLWKIVQ